MTALHQARGSAVTDCRCAAELCVIVGCDKVEKRPGRREKELIEEDTEQRVKRGKCLRKPCKHVSDRKVQHKQA